jgi:hypothetical protein
MNDDASKPSFRGLINTISYAGPFIFNFFYLHSFKDPEKQTPNAVEGVAADRSMTVA